MYKVLVIFNDGSKKIFNDVIEWGYTINNTCYYIKKNNPITIENYDTVMSFIRVDTVKYIGPAEFWEEEEESKIIHCKDCEYYEEDLYNFSYSHCTRCGTGIVAGITVTPDDFCSRAVRRD